MNRRRNMLLAAGAIVFLGLAVALAFLALHRPDVGSVNPRADYRSELETLVRSAQPDGENAWPCLLEIVDRFMTIHKAAERRARESGVERDREDFGDVQYWRVARHYDPEPNLSPDVNRELATLGDIEQTGIWHDLRHCLNRNATVRTLAGEGMIIANDRAYLSRQMSPLRQLASARTATLRLAAKEERWPDVQDAIEDILALGHLVSWQSANGFALSFGTSIQSKASVEPRYILIMNDSVDNAALEAMLEPLNDAPSLIPSALVVKGEILRLRDAVQWLYTDDGEGDGYLVSNAIDHMRDDTGNAQSKLESNVVTNEPKRSETVTRIDELDILPQEYASTPPSEWESIDVSFDVWRDRLSEVQDELLAPAANLVIKCIWNRHTAELWRNASRLMLALEMYKNTHGDYPETLDALAPQCMDSIPADPLHGGTFGYLRLDDETDQRGYVLYTYGWDGEDDNGRMPEVSGWEYQDAIVLARQQSGFDFVFNLQKGHPAFSPQ